MSSAADVSKVDLAGVSAAEAMAALELILASDAFARVERPSRFLRHLVERTLEGRQAELKETLLGIEVFGREPAWDTRLDPIVRQEAARLRKRLGRYYETASAASDVMIELPTGAYVPVFRRSSAALAEPEAIAIQSAARPRTGLAIAGIALVCCALALTIWFRAQPAADPSIVVLPFANLSADPANEYFAAGLTDEVTDELTRLKSLKVVARTSAATFKGKNLGVREVGRQLAVTHVLDGSVERSGDRVRIIAHLERVADGSQIWSQTYERQTKDLFTVQAELAAAIAHNLRLHPATSSPPRHVPGEEAHDLFLRALFDLQGMTPDSLARAEESLRRVIQMDDQYAPPLNALAVVKYSQGGVNGLNHTDAEIVEAKDLYRKALAVDPDFAGAHAGLAEIAMNCDWDWATAERELQLAERNGPNAVAELYQGLLASFRGNTADADRHLALARSLDPTNPIVLSYMISARYWEGRYAEAIEIGRGLTARYPAQLNPQFILNLTYIEAGQAEQAEENVRKLEKRFPPARLFEAMALARSGHRAEALTLLHQLETEYEQTPRVARQWFALAWASLGDHAQTMKWLEKSADLREFQVLNVAVNPAFAEMRNDAQFRALVKRIGF